MPPLVHWRRLLPREPYRFHLGVRSGDARRFFAPTPEHQALVGERQRWLAQAPDQYALLAPEALPALAEFAQWAPAGAAGGLSSAGAPGPETLLRLGRELEPDFLLLNFEHQTFRLVGGVVCFPSSWALRDKMGKPVAEIHGVVPLLNPSLGRQIDGFLGRMAPGMAWERENWGLSPDPEWNHHPCRALPRLTPSTPLDQVWVRVEHQVFFRLPRTLALLFGIRLSLHPLRAVIADLEVAAGLRQALETMPERIAHYKNLAAIRPRLLEALRTPPLAAC